MSENANSELKELQSKLEEVSKSFAHWQGAINERVEAIQRESHQTSGRVAELSELVRETYSKVTNGLNDRVGKLETQADSFVTRREFNETARSLRKVLEDDRAARDARDSDRDRMWRRSVGIVGTALTVATVVAMYLSVGG